MSRKHEATIATSTARSSSDTGNEVSTTFGEFGSDRSGSARFYLKVPSGGGGVLTVTINGIIAGVSYPLSSFVSFTGAGTDSIVVPECPDLVTASWVIVGGGSFTFGIFSSRF